jgi:hypothetical protein
MAYHRVRLVRIAGLDRTYVIPSVVSIMILPPISASLQAKSMP